MKIYIGHHKTTGVIDGGWTNFPREPAHAEQVIVEYDVPPGESAHDHVDPARYKIDVRTKKRVALTESQRAAAIMPQDAEIRAAIARELHATDHFIHRPFDRPPLPDDDLAKMVAYRAMLRGLSKLSSPEAMVRAWSKRPGGHDPIPHLRQRLPKPATP